jgi:hypothetical protein
MAAKREALIFFCDSFCSVSIFTKKIKKNEFVYLVADGTDVTLNFTPSSPFQSGTNPITIKANTFRKEQAVNRKLDVTYSLTCTSCGGTSADPEIIVG